MLDPDEVADSIANDPAAMARIREDMEKATSTVFDLLWSGMTVDEALEIVGGAIIGTIEDGAPE